MTDENVKVGDGEEKKPGSNMYERSAGRKKKILHKKKKHERKNNLLRIVIFSIHYMFAFECKARKCKRDRVLPGACLQL